MVVPFVYGHALWSIYKHLETNGDRSDFLIAVGRYCNEIYRTHPEWFYTYICRNSQEDKSPSYEVSDRAKLFQYALHGMFQEATQKSNSEAQGIDSFFAGLGVFIDSLEDQDQESYLAYIDPVMPHGPTDAEVEAWRASSDSKE